MARPEGGRITISSRIETEMKRRKRCSPTIAKTGVR
jgi:hypothetical protein